MITLQPYQQALLDREADFRVAAVQLPRPLVRIAVRSTPPDRKTLIWLDEFHHTPAAK